MSEGSQLGGWRRWLTLVVALVALLGLVTPTARGDSDTLSPEEDNPPGCTTAFTESQDQCGAQGRAQFNYFSHIAPVDACNPRPIPPPENSRILRILPNGPRRDDASLAFVSGACVYLPPGYDTSGERYPVVYLLHGGGGDQSDWVEQGSVQQTLDDAAAAGHPVIAVMPDGRSGQWLDYYDSSFLIETYVLRYLIPYVDRHFNTIADRRGRVIAGLSNGGYGSLDLAAKAPDLFIAAGSMSGNVGARSMSGLGTPIAPGVQAQEAGAYYYGNVPISLVPNLDEVNIIMDWGASCSGDVTIDLCGTWAFEQSFRSDNQALHNELIAQGDRRRPVDYRETEGAHAWRWWSKWLKERDLPFFFGVAQLAPPELLSSQAQSSPIPNTFRYRSIAPRFSVWGYDVAVDRAQREFLDLTNVTADGMQIRGTGAVTITTAARYVPSASYTITATGLPDAMVVADDTGRLTLSVDLGPAHTVEQYSPEARVQDAAGTYTFVERTISITPA